MYTLALLLAACVNAAAALEGDTVTVRAERIGGSSPGSHAVYRDIVRQMKGDVQGHSHLWMKFSEVVSGSALASSSGRRAFGGNVYLINDAAAGLGDSHSFQLWKMNVAGIWTLHALPTGDFVVADLKDTPFSEEVSRARAEKNARIAQGLASSDPGVQYDSLVEWQKAGGLFSQIPLIVKLIDSEYKIPVANGPSSLGELARSEILRAIQMIDPHTKLSMYEDAEDYLKWWKDALNQPKPVLAKAAAGNTKNLVALPIDQTLPEVSMSPDGRRAVLEFSRLENEVEGTKNAIVLFDADSSWKMMPLYKVSTDAVNVEPDRLTVGWSNKGAAIMWSEQWYDPNLESLKFMSFEQGVAAPHPVELGIRGTVSKALAAAGSQWLFAYTTKDNQLFAGRLDANGKFSQEPVLITVPHDPLVYLGDGGVAVLGLRSTNDGADLAVDVGRSGGKAFLVSLDSNFKIKKLAPLEYAKSEGEYYEPIGLTWNGREYCVEWLRMTNGLTDFGVSFADSEGKLISRFIKLSDAIRQGVSSYPPPVPVGDGFMVSWADYGGLTHDVHIATVAQKAAMADERLVFSGKSEIFQFGSGIDSGTARVIAVDPLEYPQRIVLRELPLRN